MLRTADLGAPIADCPGWALRDVALHLGAVHLWAAAIVRSGQRQRQAPAQVRDAQLATWYADCAASLLQDLEVDPASPVWSFAGSGDVAFWRRRQALETLVHRVDAQTAAGRLQPVPDDLAADGIDEVVQLLHPRQVELGRSAPPTSSARLVAPSGQWLLGSGPVCATVSGSAADLLLLLWRRRGLDDVVVEGDRQALQALLEQPVTP